ncbi:hypothetical protein KDA_11750 [Dictyobacter alpinus]|uniref:Transposase n=1 Tax=Dictyobacter alpinus TaxID=2014873 RepID=A0A402B2W4_9CHLR|nr:IS66 family transposase [Dictyobacter alpinus]GCE25691.1 hypothetical protein KDA_11750 [Dictyobacter alpinus]
MKSEEELEHLRAENAVLRQQVSALEDLVSILQEQVQQLRDQLAKDSHNSGLPPSSNRFQRQPPKSLRQKSGKKPGGQPGHQGRHLQMVAEPDEILVHEVTRCEWCGNDLEGMNASLGERRQVVELPRKRLHIREHRVQEKTCPSCWCVTRACFPELVRGPVSYGSSIGALAVYLVQYQLLPLARASELLEDLLGVSLSEATIQSLIQRTAAPLELVEEHLKTALVQQPVIHQDETSLYVGGKPHWVHVCSTATLTHYGAHRKRGQEAMDAIGIAPQFTGTSVHDGLLSYQKYGFTHAACNAHYLRELTFIEEQYQHPWARKMKDLLLAGKRLVQHAREVGQTSLDVSLLARLRFQYDMLVTDGLLLVPASPHRPPRTGVQS